LKNGLLIILILFELLSYSQQNNNESQLALEYYRNKEFEKASDLYLKLYNQTKTKVYYNYYQYCLIELRNFEEVEKFVKKEMKKTPEDITIIVDLGFIYKSQSKLSESKECYENALKKVSSDQQQIFNLANAFISKRELEYAEQVYFKGRKNMRDVYPFSLELANIYQQQRNYQKMIDEYLYLLDQSDTYIQTVQNRLQNTIYSDQDTSLTDLLKTNLIKRIQKSGDKNIFSELLIWIYLQNKEFASALIQSKALDKRNKEDGLRIITLARTALSNDDFETALGAYRYVIEKGSEYDYYIVAKNELLSTIYKKITITNDYTLQDILSLEKSYNETLTELGINANTISLVRELSHLQAFYLGKTQEAIDRMEKAITIQGLKPSELAECKLKLGDLYLFDNDIWSATISYAQVEKNYENLPIGHDAKYKKARLAYFAGDFKWSQAQLDVLKASTSKLIANDAFYLSTLIQDNTATDTIYSALEMFARAELLLFRNQDSLAILTLDSLKNEFKTHSLADDVLYLQASLYLKTKKYAEAIGLLERIMNDFSWEILADDAAFKLATIYEYNLKDYEKAMEVYKNILIKFPGSIYVSDARNKYRKLRGDISFREKQIPSSQSL
jgi:hypothetical protein